MNKTLKITPWIFVQPLLFIALLWIIFALDVLFELHLYRFSLDPGNTKAWWGIFTFPLLHGSLEHISGNTISLFVLLTAVRYFFPQLFTRVFMVSFILPGIITWFIGRSSYHLGASGMIYSLAAFLFVSGVIRGNRYLLAVSLLVAFLYGNLFWQMFPIKEGISWEGHLSGAITGLLLSVIFRNKSPTEYVKEKEYFLNDEENPFIGDLWKPEEERDHEKAQDEFHHKIVYHIKKDKKDQN